MAVFLAAGVVIAAGLVTAGRIDDAGAALYVGVGAAGVLSAVPVAAATSGHEHWTRLLRRVVCLATLPLVALSFDQRGTEPFNPTKVTVLVLAGLLVVGTWAGEWIATGRSPALRSPLTFPALVFVGAVALSTATSVDRRASLLGLYGSYDGLLVAVACLIVFLGILDSLPMPDLAGAVRYLWLATVGPVSFYGLLQLHDRHLDWGGTWDWIAWEAGGFRDATIWSSFGNPNHLAGFLVTLLPLGIVAILVERERWLVPVHAVLLMVVAVELLETETRGAWVATAVGSLVTVAGLTPELRRRLRVAALAGAAGVGVVLGAAVLLTSPTQLLSDFASAFDLSGRSSSTQRVELWKSAVEIAVDRPLTGTGPDTFELVFPRYQTATFVEQYGADQRANGPHNVFLNRLTANGVVGLLAFVWVVLAALLLLAQRWRHASVTDRRILTGLAASVTAFVVQASFNVEQVALTTTFWVVLGLTAIALTGGRAPRWPLSDGGDANAPTQRARRLPVPGAAVAALVLLPLVPAGTVMLRVTEADLEFARGLQLAFAADQADDDAERERRLRLAAADRFERAADLNPWEPAYPAAAARQVLEGRAGDPDPGAAVHLARRYFDEAVTRQPSNWRARFEYAELLLGGGDGATPQDAALAEQLLRRAVAENPWHEAPALLLADTLATDGRLDEAADVLAAIAERQPSSADVLRSAGRVHDAVGDRAGAEDYWRRLLALVPGDAEASDRLEELTE